MRGPFLAVLACAAATAAACTSTNTSVTAPSADKCQVSASAPGSFDAAGGTATVAVSAARDCAWSAAANVSWATITGSRSGQGDGTIAVSVAANPAPAARSGTLDIGSQTVPLSQAAAPCRYSISRGSDSVGVNGGSLSIQVTTLAGCSWTASSNASWLSVTSGSTGNASATISMSVAANPGGARVGQLNVGGQIYTVNQEGVAPPPAPAPSPSPTPSPAPAPGPTPAPTPAPAPAPTPAPKPSPPPPSPTPTPTPTSFTGLVLSVGGSCPALTLNVSGRTVTSDKDTKFKDVKCNDIKFGMVVSVQGTEDASGVVNADVIQKAGDHEN